MTRPTPRLFPITAAVALTVGVATLTACQPKEVPPPAVAADAVTMYPRVTATGGLNAVLRVREGGVSRTADPVLSLSIPVRNTAERTMFVQYRYFFFDADGQPLDANPSWTRARLAPGAEVYMQGAAVSQDATDFRLEIRPQI